MAIVVAIMGVALLHNLLSSLVYLMAKHWAALLPFFQIITTYSYPLTDFIFAYSNPYLMIIMSTAVRAQFAKLFNCRGNKLSRRLMAAFGSFKRRAPNRQRNSKRKRKSLRLTATRQNNGSITYGSSAYSTIETNDVSQFRPESMVSNGRYAAFVATV